MNAQFKVTMIFDEKGKELKQVEMTLPYVPREGDLYFKSDKDKYEICSAAYWESTNKIMVMARKINFTKFDLYKHIL